MQEKIGIYECKNVYFVILTSFTPAGLHSMYVTFYAQHAFDKKYTKSLRVKSHNISSFFMQCLYHSCGTVCSAVEWVLCAPVDNHQVGRQGRLDRSGEVEPRLSIPKILFTH